MSRIGDNSDDQRIKEMQEAELRNRVDREKKDNEVRTAKSFQQVMQDRGKQAMQKAATQGQAKAKEDAKKQQEKSPLNRLLQKAGKPGAELQRRAALSSALSSSMAKTRSADAQQTKAAESERVDDLQSKQTDEKDRIDKDLREANDADTKRAEEKEADARRIDPNDPRNGGDQGKVDERDQRRHQRGQGQGDGDDQRRAQGVQAAEAKQLQKHEPRISQEVIDRIVNAIQTAHHADGRTEMQIELKGTMLDGVKLKVLAKNGQVHCTFVGCDRDTRNLLEASKGALMRGLAKKGMSLASLKVS